MCVCVCVCVCVCARARARARTRARTRVDTGVPVCALPVVVRNVLTLDLLFCHNDDNVVFFFTPRNQQP